MWGHSAMNVWETTRTEWVYELLYKHNEVFITNNYHSVWWRVGDVGMGWAGNRSGEEGVGKPRVWVLGVGESAGKVGPKELGRWGGPWCRVGSIVCCVLRAIKFLLTHIHVSWLKLYFMIRLHSFILFIRDSFLFILTFILQSSIHFYFHVLFSFLFSLFYSFSFSSFHFLLLS